MLSKTLDHGASGAHLPECPSSVKCFNRLECGGGFRTMASRSGGSESTVASRFCRAIRRNHLCRHHRAPRPRPLALRWELILTTGLGLPDDPGQRTAYIHGLREIGVTAVGFGTGLTFEEVPDELIAAADDCGLALFEVRWPPLSSRWPRRS